MKMRFSTLVYRIVLLAILTGTNPRSWGQSATTGALTGTVTDSNGAAIPNVTVTLTNTGTAQIQKTATNDMGLFGFSLLPPGTYEVEFAAAGFKTSGMPSLIVDV